MNLELTTELQVYLRNVSSVEEDPGGGYIPPLSPNGRGHVCDIICKSLGRINTEDGSIIPGPGGLQNRTWDTNLCDSLRRYLRQRLPRLRIDRKKFHEQRERELRDYDFPAPGVPGADPPVPPPILRPGDTYVACYTIFDQEIDNIVDWLRTFGQEGSSCGIDGLIRSCQTAPWYYDFDNCQFRDKDGNPNPFPGRNRTLCGNPDGGDPNVEGGYWPCIQVFNFGCELDPSGEGGRFYIIPGLHGDPYGRWPGPYF